MLQDKRGAEGKFAMVSREPRLLFSPNLAGTARGGNREKKRKREMLQQPLSEFQYFSIISVYFSQNRQSGEKEEKRNTAASFQQISACFDIFQYFLVFFSQKRQSGEKEKYCSNFSAAKNNNFKASTQKCVSHGLYPIGPLSIILLEAERSV